MPHRTRTEPRSSRRPPPAPRYLRRAATPPTHTPGASKPPPAPPKPGGSGPGGGSRSREGLTGRGGEAGPGASLFGGDPRGGAGEAEGWVCVGGNLRAAPPPRLSTGKGRCFPPTPPPPRAAPGSPPCPDAPAPCWARARPTGRAACCRRGCPEGLRFGLGAETRAGHRLPGPGRAGSGGAGPGQGRGQVGGAGRLRPLGCGVGGGGLGVPFGRSSPSLWWV